MLKIRYKINYPFAFDHGGGRMIIDELINYFKKENQVLPLDLTAPEVDFNILFIFTFNSVDVEVLKKYKEHGVKIILFPIFDRLQPLWKMKLLSRMYFPVHTEYAERKHLTSVVDAVVTHNLTEQREVKEIYDVEYSKMHLYYLGINPQIIEYQDVSPSLFLEKYKIQEPYILYPAASINHRKNQLSLLKAFKGRDKTIILLNGRNVQDGLESELESLVENNSKFILVKDKLDWPLLVSAIKASAVCVSTSVAETAGLANLECAFLGAKLAVSDLPAHREYLRDYPVYFDQNIPESIRKGVETAINKDFDSSFKQTILKNYTWQAYSKNIESLIKQILV